MAISNDPVEVFRILFRAGRHQKMELLSNEKNRTSGFPLVRFSMHPESRSLVYAFAGCGEAFSSIASSWLAASGAAGPGPRTILRALILCP